MITKCIIPVAGFGTRFLPVTKAQPKEMLSIVDKPVIQFLVEEAVASGIKDIIFVTGRGKRSIEDHFDCSFELEYNLVEKGKQRLLEEVRHISELANFFYVRQPKPLGDGHAILCAKEFVGNEPVAILFGDDIVDAKTPCLKQLMNVFEKYNDSVIALMRVPEKDVDKYGVVDAVTIDEGIHEIKKIIEKPSIKEASSNLIIVGKYIITPEVFQFLEKTKLEQRGNGEIKLANTLQKMIIEENRPIYGYEFEGRRYDCGSKLGLLEATVDFALRHPEVKNDFKKYLRRRIRQERMLL